MIRRLQVVREQLDRKSDGLKRVRQPQTGWNQSRLLGPASAGRGPLTPALKSRPLAPALAVLPPGPFNVEGTVVYLRS